MKVLHLGSVPLPEAHPLRASCPQHPGRWVLHWAQAQQAAGMDVELACILHKSPRDFTLDVDGVRVHYLRTFHPYRHLTFFAIDQCRLARLARSLRPDLVVAHGTEGPYGWGAVRSGLPFCLVAQGLFFRILQRAERSPNVGEFFFRQGEHFVWKRTRNAVCVSDYVEAELRRRYPHLRTFRIPLTYDTALEAPVCCADKDPNAVACVGSICENKGYDEIVQAFRILAERESLPVFHVVGAGSESDASYAGKTLRSLRAILGPKLVCHGQLLPHDVFRVLDECGILLAPSREEMFGCQLVEGLMRGCHGIVTENTALAENGRRFGNATIIPQRDPGGLARAISNRMRIAPDSNCIAETRRAIQDYMSPSVIAKLSATKFSEILREWNCAFSRKTDTSDIPAGP